jgi:hypothetical protein
MMSDGKNAIRRVSIVKFTGVFTGYVKSRTNADTVARTAKDVTTTIKIISVIRTDVDIPRKLLESESAPFLL